MFWASAFGSAGNTYLDLDYSGYHKKPSINWLQAEQGVQGILYKA